MPAIESGSERAGEAPRAGTHVSRVMSLSAVTDAGAAQAWFIAGPVPVIITSTATACFTIATVLST